MRRRDAGDLAGAAQLLRDRLAAMPDDGDALRLLAQLTYWLGDRAAARALYESALERHPTDTAVRLDYGQMLVETLAAARARQVLLPLARGGSGRARASTLLGRLAYWHADRSAAVRHFRSALDADPGAVEPREGLREIAWTTSPWVRFDGGYRSDDQPMTQGRGGVEVGWFPTPNWSLAIGAAGAALSNDVVRTRNVGDASVRALGFVPGARVDIDAQLGVHRRSYGSVASDVVGRAVVRVRLREGLKLRGGVERLPYLHTAASLDSAVVPVTIEGALQLQSAGGWEGEAALQRQAFQDDNAVSTAYAWLLAPVVRGTAATLKVGYAFAAQDADSTRFVLENPPAAPPPSNVGPFAGRFVPYFTPDDLVGHSVLGALVLRAAGGTTFRVDGRYGVHVTDREPVFAIPPGPPGGGGVPRLGSRARSYTPYELRGALDVPAGRWNSFRLAAEHYRTVLFARSEVSLALFHRFAGARARGDAP